MCDLKDLILTCEKATGAVGNLGEANRKLETSFRNLVSPIRNVTSELDKLTRQAASLELRLGAVSDLIDPLRRSSAKLNGELQDSSGRFQKLTKDVTAYGSAVREAEKRVTSLNAKSATSGGPSGPAAASKSSGKASSDQVGKLGGALSSAALGAAAHDGQSLIAGLAGIAEVFATASAEGVGFGAVLAGLAAEAAPLALIAAPIAIVGGLLALGTGRALENEAALRSFNAQLALNADGLNYSARALTETSQELSHYGLSAEDARKGLSTFIKDGVDPSKLKDFSIAAENLSEVLGGDVNAAQESVSKAFTGGYDAVAKLDQEYNYLTASQLEHIRVLYDGGRATDAQAEAFDAFSKKVEEAAEKTRGPMQVAVRELSGAWSDFLDNLSDTTAVQGAVAALEGLMKLAAQALNMSGPDKKKADPAPAFMRDSLTSRLADAAGPGVLGFALRSLDQAGRQRSRDNFYREQAEGLAAIGKPNDAGKPSEREVKDSTNRVHSLLQAADKPTTLTQALAAFHKDLDTAKGSGIIVTAAQKKLVEDKLAKDYAPASPRPHSSASAVAQHADDQVKATKDAIARADKDELTAQMALTQNIDVLAGYRKQQIDKEAEEAKAKLKGDAKIDPKRLEGLNTTIDNTAVLKKRAVDQQLIGQQIEKEVQQRSALAGYADRELQARASMATSLADAQAAEVKSLVAHQTRELDDEKSRQAAAKNNGTFDPVDAEKRNSAIAAAQAAERAALDQKKVHQLAERDLADRQALSGSTIDLLQSQKGLAMSAHDSAKIDREILAERYKAERDTLQSTTVQKGYSQEAEDRAKARLPTLDAIHRNELKQLDLSDNLATAIASAVEAFGGLARSVAQGDVGGSISGLSKTFKEVGGLMKDGPLKNMLGDAAGFLGPVGTAVSAVTSVLGAFGQASAAKAQKKLEDLHQSVKDLRTANLDSSHSISGALEEANKTSNTGLDYSNAMLASLRSIDSQIGAVANAIARSIKTGGLLDTSGLGLGTTGSTTGSLFGVVTGLLFGNSKTKTELLDQGLVFNPTSYGALANGGVTGQTYADLVSTTTKKLLGVTTGVKVKTSTVYGGVDADLMGQITGVIKELGEGVVTAAATFGPAAEQSAKDALASVNIDLGKLSLKDLKPDEIEAAINAMFDKVADDLASAGLPGLEALAKTGEGAFETLTRLATEYKAVDASLASVGMKFGTSGLGSLGARDDLLKAFGGMDAFSSATAFFGEHFLTDDDRLKPLKTSVASSLTALGQPADLSREGFKALVQKQDLSTPAGAALYKTLMDLAPAFDKVTTAAEAAKAAVDDKRTSIQDQIDELTLSPTAKLAKSRDAEMKAVVALDAALVPLLKNLWDLQDAADAAKLATDRQSLYADLLDAQGKTDQATALKRQLALAAITDPLQQLYQTQIWAAQDAAAKVSAARDVLTQAYQREHDAIQATKDKFEELSKSLRGFSASLSDTIAGADPGSRYRTTRDAFMTTAALARLGDPDAMGRLQETGEAFTSASHDYASTSQDYLRDVGLVRSAVDEAANTADRQVSIAQQQLDDLDASVKGLIEINANVISVKDAIVALQAANAQARSAGVVSVGGIPIPDAPTSNAPQDNKNKTLDGAYYYDSMLGQLAYTASLRDPQYYPGGVNPALTPGTQDYALLQTFKARDASQYTYLDYMNTMQHYATGGGFEVGGSGPPDSKLFSLALSPGEAVNVQRADQKNDRSLINELRSLREEVANLRASSDRIATSNDKMERTLTNVTEGGRAMQTQAAA